jgi:hypothetical protein
VCPYRVLGAQSGSLLERGQIAQKALLWHLYEQRDRQGRLSLAERNELIRQRYAAGETHAQLAKAFGISTARVGQILHRKHH